MKDIKSDLQMLTVNLQQALQDKNTEKAAIVYDELFNLLSPDFDGEINIHQQYICYGEALLAMLKYLANNNFYEKAHRIVGDIESVVELGQFDEECSEEVSLKLAKILKEAKLIVKAVPEKHRNLTIPRLDTKCCLCRNKPANKTGSHMVPNFLTAPTFTWDGKPKRNREALDHCFLNDVEKFVSYYGSDVSPERIEKTLGHEMTDADYYNGINETELDSFIKI